jgi:hypothetical protein
MPVIGFVQSGSADAAAGYVAAFRKGLAETGYVEGQNVTHWGLWRARWKCRPSVLVPSVTAAGVFF